MIYTELEVWVIIQALQEKESYFHRYTKLIG